MREQIARPDERSPSKVKRKTAILVFLCGTLIPLLILLFVYMHLKIWPFGDRTLVPNDSIHQYLPFLVELRRHLVEKTSLFYSFSGGLGYNFWATIAYYAASPLNLITVFIPESSVIDFYVWAIVVRLALSGGILAWYLYRRNREGAIYAVALGCMYALSNFFLGYKYNSMWLDTIAVTPLLMFGLERLVKEKRSGIYMVVLFYAVWCNYYMGFMLCLFACLYFAFLLFSEESLPEKPLRSLKRFAFSSIAAGASTAVLTLPTWMALRISSSVGTGKGMEWRFYTNYLDVIHGHYADFLPFKISADKGDALLYFGTAVLLFVALYFVNPSVRKKERLGLGALLLLIFVSFNFAPLNYIWHGFHQQIGIPNRFAFLYLILLACLCHSSLCQIRAVNRKQFLFAAGAVLFLTAWITLRVAGKEQETRGMIISLIIMAAYAAFLYFFRSRKKHITLLSIILCFVMVVEAAGNTWFNLSNLGTNSRDFYYSFHEDAQKLLKEDQTGEFFRADLSSGYMVNVGAYIGANGIMLFSSDLSLGTETLFRGFGVSTVHNKIRQNGFTKPVKDIYGQRYFITKLANGDTLNATTKIAERGDWSLYENRDALSLGYVVSDNILNWEISDSSIETINDFMRLACGVPDLLQEIAPFQGESGGKYALFFPGDALSYIVLDKEPASLTLTTPEYTLSSDSINRFIMEVYVPEEGQYVTFSATTKDEKDYTGNLYTCSIEDYRQAIAALGKNQLEQLSVSADAVSGTFCADEGGVLLLTIPYDAGWSIELDGNKVNAEMIGGALIGIPVTEGSHSLSMRYVPPGFWVGSGVSLMAVAMWVVLLVLEKKQRR